MIALVLALAAQEGIAAQYPGDEGIEKDPRVLFVEDFETGEVREIGRRWGQVYLPENLDLAADVHENSPGNRSIHVSKNGHLFTHTRGADRLHARFYVKFHPRTGYIHHFVHLLADRSPAPFPKGGAGLRPKGDQGFSSGIEPYGNWGQHPAPGVWNFYSYWHEMKGDARGNYWGNSFTARQEPIQPGRWYAVEAMMKANSSPEAADGEQAFWVDGKLVGEFKGIRWRTSDKVKLNTFWLLYYWTDQAARHNKDTDPNRVYEAWFDDIVLATEYVGPVRGKPRGGKKAAVPGQSALHARGMDLPLPAKVVFSETFEGGPGKFGGGESREGALAVPAKGVSLWGGFSAAVRDSTLVRFKLKPLADVDEVMVQVWSDANKNNARQYVTGLRKGEWNEVRIRAGEIRVGPALDGPSLEGATLNNFSFIYQGPADARILLDNFEVRE